MGWADEGKINQGSEKREEEEGKTIS